MPLPDRSQKALVTAFRRAYRLAEARRRNRDRAIETFRMPGGRISWHCLYRDGTVETGAAGGIYDNDPKE